MGCRAHLPTLLQTSTGYVLATYDAAITNVEMRRQCTKAVEAESPCRSMVRFNFVHEDPIVPLGKWMSYVKNRQHYDRNV